MEWASIEPPNNKMRHTEVWVAFVASEATSTGVDGGIGSRDLSEPLVNTTVGMSPPFSASAA